MNKYNIILCRIDKAGNRLKKYTLTTATTECEAYKKSYYYSHFWQNKGLYNIGNPNNHFIITFEKV